LLDITNNTSSISVGQVDREHNQVTIILNNTHKFLIHAHLQVNESSLRNHLTSITDHFTVEIRVQTKSVDLLAHSAIQEATVIVPRQSRERSIGGDSFDGRYKVGILEGDELVAFTRKSHQFVVVGHIHTTENRVEGKVQTLSTHITQNHKIRVQGSIGELTDLEQSASSTATNGEHLTSDRLHGNGADRISDGKIFNNIIVGVGSHHEVSTILIGKTQVESRIPVRGLTALKTLANTIAVQSDTRIEDTGELFENAAIGSALVVESTSIGILANHSSGDADTILTRVSGTRIIVLTFTLRVRNEATSRHRVAHGHLASVDALRTGGGETSRALTSDTDRRSGTSIVIITRSFVLNGNFNASTISSITNQHRALVGRSTTGDISHRAADTLSIALRLSNARQIKRAVTEVRFSETDSITAEVISTFVLIITVLGLTDTTLRSTDIISTRIVITAGSGRIVGVIARTSKSVTSITSTRVVIITVVGLRHNASLINADISAAKIATRATDRVVGVLTADTRSADSRRAHVAIVTVHRSTNTLTLHTFTVHKTRVRVTARLVLKVTGISETGSRDTHTSTARSVKVRAVLRHTLTNTIHALVIISTRVAIITISVARTRYTDTVHADIFLALRSISTANHRRADTSTIDARIVGARIVITASGTHRTLSAVTSDADRFSTRVFSFTFNSHTKTFTISAAIVLSTSITIIAKEIVGSLNTLTILAHRSDTIVVTGASKRSTLASTLRSTAIVDGTRVSIITRDIRSRFIDAVAGLRLTNTNEASLFRTCHRFSANTLSFLAHISLSAEVSIIARNISVDRVTLASNNVALTSHTHAIIFTLVGILIEALVVAANSHFTSISFLAIFGKLALRKTVFTNSALALTFYTDIIIRARITIATITIDVFNFAQTSSRIARRLLAFVFRVASDSVGSHTLTLDTNIKTSAEVAIITEVSTRKSSTFTSLGITEGSETRAVTGTFLSITRHANTSHTKVINSTRITIVASTIHRNGIALSGCSVALVLHTGSRSRTSHTDSTSAGAINTDVSSTSVTIITRIVVGNQSTGTINANGIETDVVTNASARSTNTLAIGTNVIQSALVLIVTSQSVVNEDTLIIDTAIVGTEIFIIADTRSTNAQTFNASVINSASVTIITKAFHIVVNAATILTNRLETGVTVSTVQRNTLADTSNATIILSTIILIVTSTIVIKINDFAKASNSVTGGFLTNTRINISAAVSIITEALSVGTDISRSTSVSIVATKSVVIILTLTSSFIAAISSTKNTIVTVDRSTTALTSGTTIKSSAKASVVTRYSIVNVNTLTTLRIAGIIGTNIVVVADNTLVNAFTILARTDSAQVTIITSTILDRSLHTSTRNASGSDASTRGCAHDSGTLASFRDRVATIVGSTGIVVITGLVIEESVNAVTEATGRGVAG